MTYLHQLTTYDRFSYPEQPILFFYNTDADCKKKRNLKENEPSIVLYVHSDVTPFVLQGPNDDLSSTNLLHWISLSITQFSLKWDRRSAGVV